MICSPCRALRLVALGFTFALIAPAAMSAQQGVAYPTRHEIIKGTVSDAAGKPVPNADVTATRAPDRLFRQSKTDTSGAFIIDWPDGTGDYLVHVAAVGFGPFRQRVTTVGDSIFIVDAKLTSTNAVQTLAPVVSTAARARPTRDAAPLGDPGATEQTTSGMNGVVPPSLAGDLSAIASTMPGVLATAQGPSVLGLPSSQNSTTLNGMAFAGGDMPRDANTRVRVSGSQYDPARGWFSGANTNVELGPGNIFSNRRTRLTLDAPPLQYSDPLSSRLGQRFTNTQLSLGGDGELIPDAWYYNYGLQGGRRSADPASLFNASDDLLRLAGVAPDSVARLRELTNRAGIPIAGPGTPGAATTESFSALGRFDHKPYDAVSLGAAKSTWGVTGYGRFARAGRLNASPTTASANEGETLQQIAMAQVDYSRYFGPDYLAFFRTGLTGSRNRSIPYVLLPSARVLVQSDLENGESPIAPLAFGGGSNFGGDLRQRTWETSADVQFFAAGSPRHRIKLHADVRLDSYEHEMAANTLGTFGYASLAELEANAPSFFTRALQSPPRAGGEWNAFLAASDVFRASQTLQFLFGLRLEGNAFTSAPAYNPVIDDLYGARTDAAPRSMHVSPRVGFTWNRSGQIRNAVIGNPVGTFGFGAPGVLRGGFGEFRSITPASLLSLASVATGLPSGLSRVSCIGAAVPAPDWRAYGSSEGSAAIPTMCADGSAGSFNDTAPAVHVVAPEYGPPRSWRGNLAWASVWKSLNYTVEGTYSLNLDQPGATDLNFAGAPKFMLAGEQRTMYVPPDAIVPSSGLLATSGSRRSTQFGRVTQNRGDGRSESRQITVTARPDLFGAFGRNVFFLTGYTLSSVRSRQRGFDATTFGDPRVQSWARADLDARHQFVMQAGNAFGPVTATLTGRAQSGLPFTPTVSNDVNGDGFANDRAFIADPAMTGDPLVRSGIESLIATSEPGVRDCLVRQLGRAAGAASCEGPWSATLNGQLSIAGNGRFLTRRATINLGLVNILGGVDQLVHGPANRRGWGETPLVDPVLLSVTGFNPGAGAFDYAVNPRFGTTRAIAGTARAPFQLTVDVSFDIGRRLEAQQIDRWLAPGRTKRGLRATPAELKRRFERNVPDMYRLILQQSDSLLLSRSQVEALQRAQAEYKARIDGIWIELATRLAGLPEEFDSRDAAKRLDSSIDRAWTMTRDDLQGTLKVILTPVQLALIPGPVKGLIESTGPVRIRIFISG